MRVERCADGSYDVYVRQSWINDALMCNERGRYGVVQGHWSIANELTAIGTAVHYGIAAKLNGSTRPIVDEAIEEWHRLLLEPMRWVKHSKEESVDFIRDLTRKWENEIAPLVGEVIGVEQEFQFQLDEFTIAGSVVRVWGKGTIDLVSDPMWDWKTSARKYNAREKQNLAVQPTMYAAAAVANGWAEYPVRFNYGVMIRGGGTQVVEVFRTSAHEEWLRRLTRPLVRQAILLGTEESWPLNDSGYLCSETWCSWFSLCKGAVIAPADNVAVPVSLTHTLEGSTQ